MSTKYKWTIEIKQDETWVCTEVKVLGEWPDIDVQPEVQTLDIPVDKTLLGSKNTRTKKNK